MLKRAIVLAGVAVVLMAAPVSAQSEYDGASGETSVLDDGSVRVTGEGCPSNADVAYSVTKDGDPFTSGTSRADVNGDFSFTYASQGGGDYSTAIDCGGVSLSLDTVVPTVLGTTQERGAGAAGAGTASGDRAGALAFTGSDRPFSLLQIGAALLVLGGVGLGVARRRRHTTNV